MKCTSPPELDEIALAMALEGEASARVTRHLEHCPACHERARQLAHVQGRLKDHLHRITCPSLDALRDYQFGLLTDREAAEVDQHLAVCPRCSWEMAQSHAYQPELASQPGLLERVAERARLLVARLVDDLADGVASGWTVAPAGVRGQEEPDTRLYQAGDLQIAIERQASEGRPGWWDLVGLVLGHAGPADLAVDLWRDGDLVATARVDGAGNFVLLGTAAGEYELLLRGTDLEVQIPHLSV